MDITVVDSNGLPSKAYLSIRVGDTRRQGPYKQGEPFHFPSADHKSFVFDVFDKVGTAQVSLATFKETGSDELNKVDLKTFDGSSMNVALKVETKAMTDAPPASPPATKSGRPSRQQVAKQAKSYLEEHGIQPLLQTMVHQLLAQQPKDPKKYMSEFLYGQVVEPTMEDSLDDSSAAPKSVESEGPEQPEPEKAEKVEYNEITGPPVNYAAMDGLGDQDYPGFSAEKCPEDVPDLSGHFSLLADVLKKDPDVWNRLKDVKTKEGCTFARCIKTAMDNRGHPMIKTIGLVAGDEESYRVFKDVFDPVIKVRHNGYDVSAKHPTDLNYHSVSDWHMDPDDGYVISAKVRASRNVRGLRMLPSITKMERREVERLVTKSLLDLPDELEGQYFPLMFSDSYAPRPGGMSSAEEQIIHQKGLLFQEPDSLVLLSSGVGREWPDARGVFLSLAEDVQVTVNEEDHVRITAEGKNGDLKDAFTRFCKIEDQIHTQLLAEGYDYMHSEHLGYLTTCPSRVGTSMHASVLVKLPLLSAHKDLKNICTKLNLQARAGIWDVSGGAGTLDITNTKMLGSSEVDQVNSVLLGVAKLIILEKRLEAQESIEGMIDKSVEEMHEMHPQADSIFDGVPGLGDAPFPGFPVDKCPADMPDLSGHHSVMADVLKKNPAIYDELKDKKTQAGVSFAQVIKPGIDNAGHPMIKTVGVVAGDEESYNVFNNLFQPIISNRHGKWAEDATHPTNLDHSKVNDGVLDPSGSIVVSCRIRSGRNVSGFRLPSTIDKYARRQVEKILVDALLAMKGGLEGDYYPLMGSSSNSSLPEGMSHSDEESLSDDKMLFQEPDSSLMLSTGMGRHWPDARGVFRSYNKGAFVWINEEDHMKMTTLQAGGDLKKAFVEFCTLEQTVHDAVKKAGRQFMHSDKYGFVTACPSNLGTGMRANVCCNLPLLGQHSDFRGICKELKVTARCTDITVASDVNSTSLNSESAIWEFSNSARLGTSEVDGINEMHAAIKRLVEMELQLKSGGKLDLSLLPGYLE